MKRDTIFIRGLEALAVIGVYSDERMSKQPLLVDLEFDLDRAHCLEDDTLESTIDYQKLTIAVLNFIGASQYQLIETLAEHVSAHILSSFAMIKRLQVTLTKPNALPQTPHVGVTIERYPR